jgi:micrococcal nuclease
MRLWWIVPLVLLFAACELPAESDSEPVEPPPGVECQWAEVVSITDGDTVRVDLEDGEEDQAVRYIGIDTPEKEGSPDGAEPFGEEATDRNDDLVDGERVCLERDVSETDRYGRLLRYVWLEDQRLVNLVLVEEGLAEAVEFRPDVRRQDDLDAAEGRARDEGLGIWSE